MPEESRAITRLRVCMAVCVHVPCACRVSHTHLRVHLQDEVHGARPRAQRELHTPIHAQLPDLRVYARVRVRVRVYVWA